MLENYRKQLPVLATKFFFFLFNLPKELFISLSKNFEKLDAACWTDNWSFQTYLDSVSNRVKYDDMAMRLNSIKKLFIQSVEIDIKKWGAWQIGCYLKCLKRQKKKVAMLKEIIIKTLWLTTCHFFMKKNDETAVSSESRDFSPAPPTFQCDLIDSFFWPFSNEIFRIESK